MENTSENKRIARNTLLLYVRMGISMIVGLYTSRVVLQVLGVEDYGIYGVVGGVVLMFGFLNASMSGATSRFLTYELGTGNYKALKDTFISSFWVHLIIAVIIFLLAETVGLWFLYNKLVIPSARQDAAFWVYQLSIAVAMVNITQVPYNASVISHEDMGLFAYVEIVNVLLKLVIVFILLLFPFDKLVLYSVLYFCVSFGIAIFYRYYCVRNYEECTLSFVWNKPIVHNMLGYCAWDLYGNGCIVAKQQGLNFLVNMFFGLALNAGNALASTVSGTLSGFTSNLTLALRPQIIKNYAQNNIKVMQYLMAKGMKYVILLQACFSIPFAIEADYILHLWLGVVPPYTVIFCRWMLVSSILAASNGILVIGIHATGSIRRLSYISGSISLIQLPILYFIYKTGGVPDWAYILGVLGGTIMVLVNTCIIKHHIKSIQLKPLFIAILSSWLLVFILGIPTWCLSSLLSASFLRLILVAVSYISFVVVFSYFFLLSKSEKNFVSTKTKNIIASHFNLKI